MKIPKKIEKNPIAEALVELRFEPAVPDEAVFGLIFSRFSSQFPKVEQLPLLQLPNEVRKMDPNLRYRPLYKLSGEHFFLQVGPRVFSINVNLSSYPGWHRFSSVLIETISQLHDLNIVKAYDRFGMRYVNFFPEDVFRKSLLEVLINKELQRSSEQMVRLVIEEGNFKIILMANNHSTLNTSHGKQKGSVLDLDLICTADLGAIPRDPSPFLDKAHIAIKTQFYRTLTEETIAEFKPTYE